MMMTPKGDHRVGTGMPQRYVSVGFGKRNRAMLTHGGGQAVPGANPGLPGGGMRNPFGNNSDDWWGGGGTTTPGGNANGIGDPYVWATIGLGGSSTASGRSPDDEPVAAPLTPDDITIKDAWKDPATGRTGEGSGGWEQDHQSEYDNALRTNQDRSNAGQEQGIRRSFRQPDPGPDAMGNYVGSSRGSLVAMLNRMGATGGREGYTSGNQALQVGALTGNGADAGGQHPRDGEDAGWGSAHLPLNMGDPAPYFVNMMPRRR